MSAPASSEDEGDGKKPDAGDTTVPQAGVLGNLPKTRPSVRSPRRKKPEAKSAKAAEPEAGKQPSRPGRPSRPERPDRTERPEPEPVADASPASPAAELDALARGGIAIAGEAASLGLRIAGRAAAALRDAVERR